MKIAVYDIGTNSIHLLVVEIQKDLSFEVLDHEKDPTRLGDGSFASRRLAAPAMKRAYMVLSRFRKIAEKYGVKASVAVATSAVREASNRDEFVREVRRRAGLHVRVITGEEEARLIALGALASVDTRGRRALVIDVGGGSVETILSDGRKAPVLASFKLGVARLSDRFIKKDPPARKELAALEEHVEEASGSTLKRLRQAGFSTVIGTSGTMISLASTLHEAKKGEPLQRVNHYEVSAADLERLHARLSKMTWKERLRVPGLDPKRADLVVAGGAVVTTMLRLLRVEHVTLSDHGIREGVVLDFIERHRTKLRGQRADGLSVRERSVRSLARRCAADEAHAEHVGKLSLQLFDQTRALHGLGDRERELLRYAALLHEIGQSVSFKGYHKHTEYLIVNGDLEGFSAEEIAMLGVLGRTHRKRVPKRIENPVLGKRARQTALFLASLLRIAAGLDRSHSRVVESVRCRIGRRDVSIIARARGDAELDLWQANDRADLFERVFRRKASIRKGSR